MITRKYWQHLALTLAVFSTTLSGAHAVGQSMRDQQWTEDASFGYGISADITYGVFQNVPMRLDVWRNERAKGAVPTLFYVHGGGWVFGDKNGAVNLFLPYLQRGWNVVNVEYRMAGQTPAPAAVEDVRCALRWVYRNAATYHLDTTRIVTTGHSAGGHLALMAAMVPTGSELDAACPADDNDPPLKVAAVVNWYGISDVREILDGPDRRTYAVAWMGSQSNRDALADRLSPLHYVRKDLPPVITIHGDQDPTVPYSQATRLRDALTAAGVPNLLKTIHGGSHGNFSNQQTEEAFTSIWKFFADQHVQNEINEWGAK